ncbi:MAG: sugar ABC transporter permease [Desulfobacterales bacterium]|nr:MAG: sugar ABC transporter permease [Desulfobacterales bacterium]
MTIQTDAPTRKRVKRWRQRNLGFFMVLPAALVLLAVGIFPLIYSIGISFLRWEAKIPGRPFVWFENYASILSNMEFWHSLKITAILVGIAVSIEFCIGLWLAVLVLNSGHAKRIFMPIFMLPVMMVPVVVGFTWRMLWDPLYGPINQILGWLVGHQVTISWLTNASTALPAILVTEVWQWTPFMFLVLLAGLSAVNPELQEAAAIDGASEWKTFWAVTLPVIRPVVLVAILFRVIDVIKIFDIVYVTTGGGPGYATQPVTYYLYRTGARFFRMGYTAAGSWVLLILVACLVAYLVHRVGED